MINKSYVIGIILLFILLSMHPMAIGLDNELIKPSNENVIGPMDSPWPMFGHDARHTGRSQYSTKSNNGGIKWTFEAEFLITSSPIIDNNNTIYFTSWNYLYAVYPNGAEKWHWKNYEIGDSSPAIAEDGTIYVCTNDGMLYAINPDGTVKWSFKGIARIKSSPTIGNDGTIYYSTFNEKGKFYAINPDGTEKWHYDADYFCQQSPVIADDGTIYFNSHVSLYSFYPNGTLIWKKKIGDPNFTFLSGPAIGDDEIIYLSCDPGYLYAIYSNGTTKWRSSTEWSGWSTPSIGIDGTIYIGYKYLYAFYPNGTIKWIFKLDESGSHHIDSRTYALSSDGDIFVGTCEDKRRGYIIAINPDGSEKWREKVSDYRVLSSPAIGVDGTIYIGGYRGDQGEGALYAINGKKFEDPVIVKPELGLLYLADHKLCKTFNRETWCIGKITIEVFHPDPDTVCSMEFWLDDIKKYEITDPPYEWTWIDRADLSRFGNANIITVFVVNQTGMIKSDSIMLRRVF